MPEPLDLLVREREVLKDVFTWQGIARRRRFDEYASIELALIQRFIKAKSAAFSPSTVEIEGFVSRMGDRKFLLRPTLAYDDGILCSAEQLRSTPSEYEFVRVRGTRVMPKSGGTIATRRLEVTDCERIRLPTDGLQPELSLKDAAESLMSPFLDPPAQLARNVILSLTSSPGELSRQGGLTAALMPLKDLYSESNYALLEEIRHLVPRDLTGEKHLKIRVEGAGVLYISPFPWNIRNSSASMWDPVTDTRMLLRTADGPTFQETTVGFAAGSAVPKSLEDVWIRQADFPTLTEDDISSSGGSGGFDLNLAKYFISVHMNRPRIESNDSDNYLGMINRRLLKLRREYDPQGFGGLVSFDSAVGSPPSILSIARALARAHGTDTVKEEHIRSALSEFVRAREDVFQVWAELGRTFGGSVPIRVKVQRIGPSAGKIYSYLLRRPNSSIAEIREEFSKTSDRIFNQSVDELEKQGCIYPTSFEDHRFSAIESE